MVFSWCRERRFQPIPQEMFSKLCHACRQEMKSNLGVERLTDLLKIPAASTGKPPDSRINHSVNLALDSLSQSVCSRYLDNQYKIM